MSEYKTLKELLGDATESKGRKFVSSEDKIDDWFEPRFLDNDRWWVGLNSMGFVNTLGETGSKWKEIKPKTVYYRAHYKACVSSAIATTNYFKSKEYLLKSYDAEEIIEIEEREFEV